MIRTACGVVAGNKLQQALVIDRPHMRVGQAFDRVGLALKQHAFDAHQIAGQKNDNDLSTTVLNEAGACHPSGFKQVYRSAFLAGRDKNFAFAAPGRRPHRLSKCRLATDEQVV